MKQVEKVSIGGYAYSMETVAAQSARQYLDEIANHYAGESGEILEGFEERMAELLSARCGSAEVIRSADIDAVIATLGRPETIDKYCSPAPPAKKKAASQTGRQILGVCSGVARIILAAVGIMLFITGFTGVFAGGVFLFGHHIFGYDSIFAFIMEMMSSQPWMSVAMEIVWIKVLAALVWFLPFIWLLYAGIMLTFNLRSPKWHPGLILFILWLVCIIALVIVTAMATTSGYVMTI